LNREGRGNGPYSLRHSQKGQKGGGEELTQAGNQHKGGGVVSQAWWRQRELGIERKALEGLRCILGTLRPHKTSSHGRKQKSTRRNAKATAFNVLTDRCSRRGPLKQGRKPRRAKAVLVKKSPLPSYPGRESTSRSVSRDWGLYLRMEKSGQNQDATPALYPGPTTEQKKVSGKKAEKTRGGGGGGKDRVDVSIRRIKKKPILRFGGSSKKLGTGKRNYG